MYEMLRYPWFNINWQEKSSALRVRISVYKLSTHAQCFILECQNRDASYLLFIVHFDFNFPLETQDLRVFYRVEIVRYFRIAWLKTYGLSTYVFKTLLYIRFQISCMSLGHVIDALLLQRFGSLERQALYKYVSLLLLIN